MDDFSFERREGLHHAFCDASGCSVVVGGPLDTDNHFDRALVAGEIKGPRCN